MTPLAEELDGSDDVATANVSLTAERKLAGSAIFRERANSNVSLQSVFKRSIALEKTEQTLLWPL